jgi:hypothetical protein
VYFYCYVYVFLFYVCNIVCILFQCVVLCTVLLPPGVNPIADNKYIYIFLFKHAPSLESNTTCCNIQCTIFSTAAIRVYRNLLKRFIKINYVALLLLLLLLLFFGCAAQRGIWPPRSRGFLIIQNDAPPSVAVLWTSDKLVAETST